MRGVLVAFPMIKSVSFKEKNRDITMLEFMFYFIFSLPSSVEFSIIYHGRSR